MVSPTPSQSSLATVSSATSPTPSYSPSGQSTSPEYQTTVEPTSSPNAPPAVAQTPRYSVASHTVRITKHGYAIDPLELKYPEVTNQLSASSRRKSEASFSSQEVGHQVLGLIRGFWSQPGFPRGRVVKSDSQRSVSSILSEFSRNPPYPHKETFGTIGLKESRTKSSKSREKSSRNKTTNKVSSSASGKQSGRSSSTSSSSSSEKRQTNEQLDDKNTWGPKISSSSGAATAADAAAAAAPPPSQQQQQQHHKQSASTGSSVTNATTVASASKPKSSSSRTRHPAPGILSLFVSSQLPSRASLTSPPQPTTPPQAANTYHSWIPTNKEQIYDLLADLCQQMERVFTNEARIINISSPCTVLGDIHGNLSDLRTYERSLWPKAPNCVSCNYLFLGDYVDRGDYSVECVLYLFAMKLIAPNRFFMLRGNHEVAAIQRQYTFSRECEAKFGPNGRQMWKNFNKVFDLMPVAAVIDNQIFCAHGGIPRTVGELKTLINEIPSPLDNPEIQCPSAWEILWNDPITDSELVGMIEMDNASVAQTQIGASQTAEASVRSAAPAPQTETNVALNDEISPPTSAEQSEASATTTTTTTSAGQTQKKASEADSILSRDPALTGALSFYIRPESASANNQQTASSAADEKSKGKGNDTEANRKRKKETQQAVDGSSDTSDTLRTVPSDTSSIASTSPQQILNDGFVGNIKRGTAFLFSDQATKNFLKLNNLSHVIRAHEVIPTGFAFHGDGRVITIFSSSKYCGLNNQAACAFIDQGRIRILRLDTGDAGE